MKIHINKRKIIDSQPIDYKYVWKQMRALFPKRNDCASETDLKEVIKELEEFGIKTKKQFRIFMKRHRHWILTVEKEPLDKIHQTIYKDWYGEEDYLDCIRRQYWFCYPAMIRNALEYKFGDTYEKYAADRDIS